MPLDEQILHLAFEKLPRAARRLADAAAPEAVHGFRAAARRVEVLIEESPAPSSRNQAKLMKLLRRLQKKAGRVRDLDVQISALRSLKIPQEPGRKSHLMRVLVEERAEREKKLRDSLDKGTLAELRKRTKKAGRGLEVPRAFDPLARASGRLAQLEKGRPPLTETTLHQYHVAGKRARYLAELAGNSPEAIGLISALKHMQDIVGDWHDWQGLSERSSGLFGSVQDSALVAALRNITRAKFRLAVSAVDQTRAAFTRKPASPDRAAAMSSGRRPGSAA
jgi:CHAD domain-containing protein